MHPFNHAGIIEAYVDLNRCIFSCPVKYFMQALVLTPTGLCSFVASLNFIALMSGKILMIAVPIWVADDCLGKSRRCLVCIL